ncbi:uncharacterized protein LOC136081565 [Hydra vulgaris]|uniref:Uncharacterized protein LOC136081565 n=1 Tax=Hydra vulgaris TaxID=6087 RepID=A0ABM4C0B5_HYDVU
MLDGNKSMRDDKISPFVLKTCATSMAVLLTLIFQLSIKSGKFPFSWLRVNVTPIYKKGSRTDPANYRAISLTSLPCKLIEKIVSLYLSSKVFHSQRLNEAPLSPWIVAECSGKIVWAHCNCIADLVEACTHIAAVLFWYDITVKMR